MQSDVERAAAGLIFGQRRIQELLGQGWFETGPGFAVSVSRLPSVGFNHVFVTGEVIEATLRRALDRLLDGGVPFTVQCRPAQADAVARIADELELDIGPEMPLMVAEEVPPVPVIPGLTIRRLGAGEGRVHARIVADTFGLDGRLVSTLMSPDLLTARRFHVLIGLLDGRPVATGVAHLTPHGIGIYSVGTLEDVRGRGIGAALTAAAVRAGFSEGGEFAFLQSTPVAEELYRDLGFVEAERWPTWAELGER